MTIRSIPVASARRSTKIAAFPVRRHAMFRSFNLGNALVVAGLTALAVTFYLPTWSADRVARVEGRAQATAEALHEVAAELDPADPASTTARSALREALRARCTALGHPQSDLPETVDDAATGGAVFGTKHYLFRVARRPKPPTAAPNDATPTPLDVHAWPRTTLPPGRTVFFFPGDGGRPAFSRNLSAGYAGLERPPPPRTGVPRDDPTRKPSAESYRSNDDERWIRLR